MTPKRIERLRRKLQESRLRLRNSLPRFADPLQEMCFYADPSINRMSTDGKNIYVAPDWLQKVAPASLDFMLAHQLTHIYLGHIHRPALYKGFRFHLACDIIVNSYLRKLGWDMEQLPGVGTLYHKTFYPVSEGAELTPEEAFTRIPMDPAALSPSVRKRYAIDSDAYWEHGEGTQGEKIRILSPEDSDPEELVEAECPPQVRGRVREGERGLSIVFEEAADRSGAGESGQGRGSERRGSDFDEEEFLSVIDYIITAEQWSASKAAPQKPSVQPAKLGSDWDTAVKEQLKSVRAERDYSRQKAERSPGEDRIWQKVNHTCLDWRRLLDSFLQEEVCDYSFLPPDRRFQESDFFLPDFNDTMVQPLKVLFMVDTSGSVDDRLLSIAYTEITSAIEQFDGKLTGMLGFFDTRVYPPKPFAAVSDVRRMMPCGGGGTEFRCVFQTCRKYFGDDRLASLIILTDGQAAFPEESEAAGIPTFWLLTDESVLPTWGRCAYLKNP